jgi:DNA-binding MarR family transcriptional regulator
MTTSTPAQILDSELPSQLRFGVNRLARVLRHHSNGDLSSSLVSVLATLDREGPKTLGELAAAERLTPPTITRIVAQLEERGLLERTTDVNDRRISHVAVTPQGSLLLVENRSRRNAYLAERIAQLTPEQQDVLRAAAPLLEQLAGGAR